MTRIVLKLRKWYGRMEGGEGGGDDARTRLKKSEKTHSNLLSKAESF